MERIFSKELDAIIGKEFKVLDKGFIRVVDYMGSDQSIVQAARISYGSGIKTQIEDERLIRFLMRHKHTSPLEMCEIKLHVKMPIFVARQWLRHRTANVNEISARYTQMKDEFFLPHIEDCCKQSKNQKQGRDKQIEDKRSNYILQTMESCNQKAFDSYAEFVEQDNMSREVARTILPVSAYTEIYWKIDLHNLLHFLNLRTKIGAQKEIRDYAQIILHDIVKMWVPIVYESFMRYTINSKTFSSHEIEYLISMLDMEKVKQYIKSKKETTIGEDREFSEKLLDLINRKEALSAKK